MSEDQSHREPWMTDDQWACAQMFAGVCRGFHHVTGKFKKCGSGIEVHISANGFATYDFDTLTRLVVRAHDAMIRAEIVPSGPRRIGIAMWKRHTREGCMGKRHPTIEDAILTHRITA